MPGMFTGSLILHWNLKCYRLWPILTLISHLNDAVWSYLLSPTCTARGPLGLEALLVFLFTVVNPFVSPKLLTIPSFQLTFLTNQAVHSSPYVALLSFLSLTHLSLNFVLKFPTSLPFYSSKFISMAPSQDKHVTFLHLYLFTWILLVLSTVGITSLKPVPIAKFILISI